MKHILATALIIFTGIFQILAADSPRPTPQISPNRLTPTVRAVNRALPWVVNIGTEKMLQVNDPFDIFFSKFFNPHYQNNAPVKKYFPLGSGVIIDESGLIVTNYHVIQRANNVEIRLWDGTSYPATLVGFDQPNDLCLLRLVNLPADRKLDAAVFAQSYDLFLGETVITIGNPFGLEHSVSQGVLSATNRSLTESDIDFSDILQTDAAINPGNSGGPLINLDGELIGMNLAIREDAEGIGFAIPLARLELFLSNWMLPCRFSNACLGFTDKLLSEAEFQPDGLVLPELMADGPLAKNGFKAGDKIAAVDKMPITRPIDFARAIWKHTSQDKIEFTLATGETRLLTPEPIPDDMILALRLGLSLQPMTKALAKAMGTPEKMHGLVISEIIPQPLFSMQKQVWREVLKRGDLILQFNGKQLESLDDLYDILRDAHCGQTANMVVISFNQTRRTYRPISVDVILN